jgi:hypothetical protein
VHECEGQVATVRVAEEQAVATAAGAVCVRDEHAELAMRADARAVAAETERDAARAALQESHARMLPTVSAAASLKSAREGMAELMSSERSKMSARVADLEQRLLRAESAVASAASASSHRVVESQMVTISSLRANSGSRNSNSSVDHATPSSSAVEASPDDTAVHQLMCDESAAPIPYIVSLDAAPAILPEMSGVTGRSDETCETSSSLASTELLAERADFNKLLAREAKAVVSQENAQTTMNELRAREADARSALEKAQQASDELKRKNAAIAAELTAAQESAKSASAAAEVQLTETAASSAAEAQTRVDALQRANTALNEEMARLRTNMTAESAALAAEAAAAAMTVSAASAATGDEKKILEARILETERLLAAKQAEIVKVREKARSYLKDINSEKREMEAKLREELLVLTTKVEEERGNVVEAEKRCESISQELEGCLQLVSAKQKSIQALNMTLNTERSTVKDVKRQAVDLNAEFDEYKERARIALEERDASLLRAESGIQVATEEIRDQLAARNVEISELKTMLACAKVDTASSADLLRRAEKAEEDIGLLKRNASVLMNVNVTRIDELVKEAETARQDAESCRAAAADAEAKYATAAVRSEASERAVSAAEMRIAEESRISGKRFDELKAQISALEASLVEAKEAAASAHRTAAVAARAMSYTSLERENYSTGLVGGVAQSTQTDNSHSHAQPIRSPTRRDTNGGAGGEFSDIAFGSPPTHRSPANSSDEQSKYFSAELQPRNNHNEALELAARNDQIAVLMSQISELSVLLDDAQEESQLREGQVNLLKVEVRELDAKLAAADKLQDGTPFSYLRTIVVRYLETDDPALLPVLANVLSFTEEELRRIQDARVSSGRPLGPVASTGKHESSSYFASIPFLS